MIKYLREKGMNEMEDSNFTKLQKAIVWHMISRFNEVIDSLASRTTYFVKVETVGTLTDDDWRDEIHAAKQGFGKLAGKFLKVMDNIEDGRIAPY